MELQPKELEEMMDRVVSRSEKRIEKRIDALKADIKESMEMRVSSLKVEIDESIEARTNSLKEEFDEKFHIVMENIGVLQEDIAEMKPVLFATFEKVGELSVASELTQKTLKNHETRIRNLEPK